MNFIRALDKSLPIAERKRAAARWNASLDVVWAEEERQAREEPRALPANMDDMEAPARAAYAATQGRKGDWMQTAGGRAFWPMDPRADEVFIDDIAHSLAMQCRFGGHCDFHYSVAQHSVFVSEVVPREHALAGLLHDATEAYCVDLPRPIKRHLAAYKPIEQLIWLAVAERFGLDPVLPQCVHDADNTVLLAEKAQIMGRSPAPWSVPGVPARIEIAEWSPWQARHKFLNRYFQLTGARW